MKNEIIKDIILTLYIIVSGTILGLILIGLAV